jgi:hypothetical protein
MEGVSEPSTTPVRPPQVTLACGIVMVGSVFVVLSVWDRIAGLHSLDSRHALQSVLDRAGLKGSGVTLDDLMVAVKTVSMVAAACATAMVILGWQTLRRSRSARLALTILAVPLLVCGLLTQDLASAGVAAAVGTLWFGPCRTWFDDASPASPRPAGARPFPTPTRGGTPPGPPPSSRPSAAAPPTTSPTAPLWAPPPTSAYDARRDVHERGRPTALLWACALTWACASLSVVVLIGSVVVLATDSRTVLDAMHEQNPELARQGVSDHLVITVGYITCGAFLVWSLVALALALLLFRGRRWAWYALTISTSAAAVVCLIGVIGSVVVLVPLAATVATLACLVRPEVRAWLVSR